MKNDYLFFNHKPINKTKVCLSLLTKNQMYNSCLWFLAGLMLVVGDSKLVIATGLATIVMSTINNTKNFDYQAYLLQLKTSLTGANRQLALAVLSGSIVAVLSYLCLTIWAEIDNHWLAFALITQGFLCTTALGILAWYFLKQQLSVSPSVANNNFQDLVANLTAKSKIKRLLSINLLMELWINKCLTEEEIKDLYNYLCLLQESEQDKIIQETINRSLSRLSFALNVHTTVNPLTIPSLSVKRKPLPSPFKRKKIQQI